MSYLLDTNVLSELRRKQPDAHVVQWLERVASVSLYLSVLTIGEIRKCIESMAQGERRQSYLDWLEIELPRFFSGRVLPVDAAVADSWGRLTASAGRPLPAIDSLLAATAITHGLVLVTRNEKDFQHPGLTVINPWKR